MRSERVRVQWSVPLIFHGLTTLSLLPLKAVKVMTGICKPLTEGNPGISMEMGELFCSGCGNGLKIWTRLLDYQNGSTLNMINILQCRLMTCTHFSELFFEGRQIHVLCWDQEYVMKNLRKIWGSISSCNLHSNFFPLPSWRNLNSLAQHFSARIPGAGPDGCWMLEWQGSRCAFPTFLCFRRENPSYSTRLVECLEDGCCGKPMNKWGSKVKTF